MRFATAARVLIVAVLVPACSSEPEAEAAANSQLSCSSVRSEYRLAHARLRERVAILRAADEAAGRTGTPDASLNRARLELMAEAERADGRFAARSKTCVGD
jgi:hypothetical protein